MNDEINSINMESWDERSRLALTTKNIGTLNWFIPDVDKMVRLSIIKNPLFNREIFEKINYKEYELTKALLKTNFLTNEERTNIEEDLGILKQKRKTTESFCPLPWNHLGIMTNGDIRMCCQMIYEPFGMLDVNVKNIKNIDDVRNLPAIKQVRKEMLEGKKPDLCKLCWTEEKSNLKSKRIHQNSIYTTLPALAKKYTKNDGEIDTTKIHLNYFDLRLGNKCNLACRSCGPTETDQWYKEIWNIGQQSFSFYNKKEYSLKENKGKIIIDSDDFSWPQTTSFLDQILYSCNKIDRLYFTGGEPTINLSHIQFLEKLVQEGLAEKIFLEYNSNGMAMPESLLNIWPNFSGIGIGFSIDGANKKFEYLRYPGKWKKFIRTLSKLDEYHMNFKKITASLAPTVSIYNFLHILDLYEFILFNTPTWFSKHMPIHVLEGPAYMSPKIFPDHSKEKIQIIYNKWLKNLESIEKIPKVNPKFYNQIKITAKYQISNLLTYINNPLPNRDNLLEEFHNKTKFMDKQRNQNWKEIFPELVDVLL